VGCRATLRAAFLPSVVPLNCSKQDRLELIGEVCESPAWKRVMAAAERTGTVLRADRLRASGAVAVLSSGRPLVEVLGEHGKGASQLGV
jgi:hypothetical protein